MTGVTVSQLWRFPVKSMGGHRVDEVRVDRRGVHADRLWAVRDVEKGITASARRLPVLLGCSARYAESSPRPTPGPGNVPEVTSSPSPTAPSARARRSRGRTRCCPNWSAARCDWRRCRRWTTPASTG